MRKLLIDHEKLGMHNKLFRLLVFKTLTLVLPLTMPTHPFYPTK
jgi:hypothetical protein